MRASINDPGFVWGTRVYVDGVEVTDHVHTADDELGMAWGYDVNEAGQHYTTTDSKTGRTIVAPRVWRGDVRIVKPTAEGGGGGSKSSGKPAS